MFNWLRLVVVVLLSCVALSDAARVRFLLLLFIINNDKSLNILYSCRTQTAAQVAAATATIENVNRILRTSKGSVLICLMSFFALVHQGLQRSLPRSVANSHHSMDSYMDGDKLVHVINADDLLRMYKFLFAKENLPEIEKLLKTEDGRVEVLIRIFSNLGNTGTCKHRNCSTFQFGNDTHVQKALYRAAVLNNSRLCIFNDGITTQHMNTPRLLTLPPPIGAPVQNATNMKKNSAYAKSVKPAFYVDDVKVGAQNQVYASVGIPMKSGKVPQYLRELRGRWNGSGRVSDEIEGHTVEYGY